MTNIQDFGIIDKDGVLLVKHHKEMKPMPCILDTDTKCSNQCRKLGKTYYRNGITSLEVCSGYMRFKNFVDMRTEKPTDIA